MDGEHVSGWSRPAKHQMLEILLPHGVVATYCIEDVVGDEFLVRGVDGAPVLQADETYLGCLDQTEQSWDLQVRRRGTEFGTTWLRGKIRP